MDSAEDTVDLKELLGMLRRHAWLVLLVAALVLGVSAFAVLRQEPLYRATATLRLKDMRRALTGGIEDAALDRLSGSTTDPLLSQIQILRSRAVLGEVVDDQGLRLSMLSKGFGWSRLSQVRVDPAAAIDTLRLSFGPEGLTVRSRRSEQEAAYGQSVELDGVRFAVIAAPAVDAAVLVVRPREKVIDHLAATLRARARDKTDVIDIEYTSHDPLQAQTVVNALVDAFQRLNTRAAQEQSRRRRLFVEEQMAQTDSMLAEAQLALSAFRTRERVYSSRERFAAQQAGLMALEVRREELDADRRMYEALLAGLRRPRSDGAGQPLRTLVSSPGIAANPVVAQLYGQLVEFETARDTLTAGAWGRAAGNPDVERLNTLIASTETKLGDAVRSHIQAVEARIAALDDLRSRSTTEIQTLPESEAEEVRLVQQHETIRKMADQLREEYQRARIAEAVEAGQVEIVDFAALPSEPIGSRRSLKLALGLLLGLMLGGGAAFLVEHMNTSIRRREDLETVLQVPGLAVIPQIANGNGGARGRLHLPLVGSLRNGNGANGNGKVAESLVTIVHSRSSGAEAFRTLRTNLIYSQAIRTLKTIVVTSASPSEGKSTTSSNLAITFAQQGMRVLLVDCDLRKARLHQIFGLPREPGLTQLVLGYNRAGEVIRETAVEGLSVLAAGTLPPNPAELVGGPKMHAVLESLVREYDLVILDTPPLLAASDAAILGRAVDGVLLVVRAGRTEREAAVQAVRQLGAVGARVVGAVLNDPDAKVARYGGYYYYDYYGAKEQ